MQIDTLKGLLGISPDDMSKDVAIQFALDDAEQKILDFCNIDSMPKKLETTLYRMAMDIYREESLGKEENQQVSSLSEGDTSISFKNNSHDSKYSDSILKNYTSQLVKYRKLVW